MSFEKKDNWRVLIDSYLDGTIDDQGFARLKDGLRSDPGCRDAYLSAVRTDTLLREIAGKKEHIVSEVLSNSDSRRPILWMVGAVAACFMGLVLVIASLSNPSEAEISKTSGAEWLIEARQPGEALQVGDTVELASGSVEILFRSGAETRLHGPARFEITSSNGGFLHYGEADSRADSLQSEGFSIQTLSGRFIDQGTEFLMTASRDGFSQMHVNSGTVDVEVAGFSRQRFEQGSGLGVEPGEHPVMIRIEAGDESSAFQFPTIPPPSDLDWADQRQGQSTVELISEDRKGRVNLPHPNSGDQVRLIDGLGQTGPDKPNESLYFFDGAKGNILIDLGDEVPVARVHTYSWHLNAEFPDIRRRAVQRYTLWGATKNKPEGIPSETDTGGWTRIARVDTDAFFNVEREPDRPAQQACEILSSTPAIGDFRYLLFQVIPTPMPEGKAARHTFFSEIDVFTADDSLRPDTL